MKNHNRKKSAAAIIALILVLCTGCSGTRMAAAEPQAPVRAVAENPGTTQAPARSMPGLSPGSQGQTMDGFSQEMIQELMKEQGYGEEQAEDVVALLEDMLPGFVIQGAGLAEDETGKNIWITGEEGLKYSIYIDRNGTVFGIKETDTENYIYAVYE